MNIKKYSSVYKNERMNMATTQISLKLNNHSLAELDQYVDGVKFRNRSHALDVILLEWLEAQREKRKGQQQTIFPLTKSKKKRKKGDE
jgi:Arc/MetJ-type ribon-helix-helix transcriptional regulator